MGSTFFPLDRAWDLSNSPYSGALAQQMVWVSGLLPYEQAAGVLRRIGKHAVSDSSLWRMTARYGERLLAAEGQEPALAAPRSNTQPDNQQVSMDGGLVNIRGEGWKEMKVALLGQISSRLEVDDVTGQLVERPHTTPSAYTAVLGEVTAFEAALQRFITAHELDAVADLTVLADGAAWIWRLADAYFPDRLQIVDWYHACQHLAQAAQALFPAQPAQQSAWLDDQTADLWAGCLQPIIDTLQQADLAEASTYFQTHQARMRYPTFRDLDLPIGSGAVESEVKQFKARLAGPGMRWSRPAAQRMLLIRAAVLDNSFDVRWSRAA